MIDRPMNINQMEDESQNLHTFSEGLILDMEQSGRVSMTMAEAKPPTPTSSKKLAPTNFLLNTGASISLFPL